MKKAVLKVFARSLRRDQTDAERKLWRYLWSRQFEGFKFRRQQPLGSYIVDFCSFEAKVIVELDGGQHERDKENDKKRTLDLNAAGFQVIRVWNNWFMADETAALEIHTPKSY